MGLLAASPALSGSLLRIPFGAMVDRMGGKEADPDPAKAWLRRASPALP
jgi:hypothetical protein